ncbi:MAG: hypothetical protein HYY96_03905 [Candidatus Tectomicrobia bacterium]|nr:hypothetical protein [Candidatus Tectomicrobia bacterium]
MPELAKLWLGTKLDRAALAAYCQSYATWRRRPSSTRRV